MNITIKNCNNIDEGNIIIAKNKLNIKYGVNGTGKSSISKAIELGVEKKDLVELLPFKYRGITSGEIHKPSISGVEKANSILIFNEEYVNQFVFKSEEIIENSFEIFIRTETYKKNMGEIENLISDIKKTFEENKSIEIVENDLSNLSKSFGKSKSGISKAGSLSKAIGKGNKLNNIPEPLKPYKTFLESENPAEWIKWQTTGNKYSEKNDNCPYCTSEIETKKEIISAVGKEYNATYIKHLTSLKTVLDSLRDYFSPKTNTKLDEIFRNTEGLSPEQENYLGEVKSQIDTLKDKLSKLKKISFFSFKNVEKIESDIRELKIDRSSI